jgi:hypothetical protein
MDDNPTGTVAILSDHARIPMSHRLALFCGPLEALVALRGDARRCRIFEIGGTFPVLPVEGIPSDPNLPGASWSGPDEHDEAPSLALSDVAFVARASRSGPTAYIDTEYFGGEGRQSAALWLDGALVMDLTTESNRRVLEGSPINRALRGLGVVAGDGRDEFSIQGLAGYRFNRDIFNGAVECAPVG